MSISFSLHTQSLHPLANQDHAICWLNGSTETKSSQVWIIGSESFMADALQDLNGWYTGP